MRYLVTNLPSLNFLPKTSIVLTVSGRQEALSPRGFWTPRLN